MMKRLKITMVVAGLLLCFSAVPVQAQGVWGGCDGSSSAVCADKTEANDIVKRIIDVLLYAIGILSVIMIVHSGLKYTASRGDAEAVKSAKNTLLYAVIGLIIAMLSFVIVNFVTDAFKSDTDASDAAPNAPASNQRRNTPNTQQAPANTGPLVQ